MDWDGELSEWQMLRQNIEREAQHAVRLRERAEKSYDETVDLVRRSLHLIYESIQAMDRAVSNTKE